MGTRNLTMVIEGEQTKVAQYGQWNGMPGGQGATILAFLRKRGIAELKEGLKKVRFENEEDRKEKQEFLKLIGCNDGWLTSAQSAAYDKKYPLDNRDIGGGILEEICSLKYRDSKIVLQDSSSFASNSLSCEWAYVVDLDKNTFEVYEGFQESPLDETERFYKLPKYKEYYPVKQVMSFNLDNLPTEAEFIDCFKEEDAE